MPNCVPKIPAYCHHRSKGLAYVKLGGAFVYLGRHGSPESRVAYERAVTEWLAAAGCPCVGPTATRTAPRS